jgi:hypothetical protein
MLSIQRYSSNLLAHINTKAAYTCAGFNTNSAFFAGIINSWQCLAPALIMRLMDNMQQAWIVSTDMGYGHQRAVYPLRHLGGGQIIDAANNSGISPEERRIWEQTLNTYELFSRAGKLPLIGRVMARMLDRALYIPRYYPMRDLSGPTFQVKMLKRSIKRGLCGGVMAAVAEKQLPILTSFYAPAIAADMRGEHRVYCIICDADLNRVWVAEDPCESNIIYLAPTGRVAKRLESYGVSADKIFVTGFPLPMELVGGRDMGVLLKTLSGRLSVLDPKAAFCSLHGKSVEHFLGKKTETCPPGKILTITFAVGGAGAQIEIGDKILYSLRNELASGQIKLILSAGTKIAVKQHFVQLLKKYPEAASGVSIVFGENNSQYFDEFNKAIAVTDILWTKPSELSFYTALGIPVIMCPAIGPQELFNKQWLTEIGAGIKQGDPEYTHQWLPVLLEKGRLAEMAWAGFLKARKLGSHNISDIISTGKMEQPSGPLSR